MWTRSPLPQPPAARSEAISASLFAAGATPETSWLKNIGRSKALDHVFGYTVINDVSARDLQRRHLQWFKGKSLDGSCPIGPVVVTADEFAGWLDEQAEEQR